MIIKINYFLPFLRSNVIQQYCICWGLFQGQLTSPVWSWLTPTLWRILWVQLHKARGYKYKCITVKADPCTNKVHLINANRKYCVIHNQCLQFKIKPLDKLSTTYAFSVPNIIRVGMMHWGRNCLSALINTSDAKIKPSWKAWFISRVWQTNNYAVC